VATAGDDDSPPCCGQVIKDCNEGFLRSVVVNQQLNIVQQQRVQAAELRDSVASAT